MELYIAGVLTYLIVGGLFTIYVNNRLINNQYYMNTANKIGTMILWPMFIIVLLAYYVIWIPLDGFSETCQVWFEVITRRR